VRWLGAAFGVAWLLLGAYIVRLWRAQRDLRRRLEELDRREG
jgi:CcmD family protein